MLRLKKYLKPYWKEILMAMLLVVVVAWTNLQLPDYLSQIVNVGIQQQGIDSGVPQALRKTTMDKMAVFQSAEDHAAVLANYTLIEPGSPAAADLVKTYPILEREAVYSLVDTGKPPTTELEALMAKPLILVQAVNMIQSDPAQAAQLLGDNFPLNIEQLPAEQDLAEIFALMPAAQREAALQSINDHLSSLEGRILHQITVNAISGENAAMGVNISNVQTNYILRIGGLMIAVSIVGLITSLLVSFLAARTSAGLARDLRSGVFSKVESFSSAEYDKFSTATLITRTTNDVVQVQMVTFILIRLGFQAPLLGGLGIVRALEKSPNMWWTIALAVLLLIVVILTLLAVVTPKFKLIQSLIDRLNLVMRENLSGIMVVRAFNKQEFEEDRFDQANRAVTNNQLFVGRAMSLMFPLMTMIMTGAQVFIIWIGAQEIARSALQVGDLIAFMQYAMQILTSFLNLSMLFVFLPRASVSGNRVADVLETEVLIKEPENPVPFPVPLQGVVEFHDVDFRYPGAEEDVLHDISFKAEPGQVTAIIGSTGSGKSTLVSLLPRFFEVSKGSITLDGIDIRDVCQADLRNQIGYAPQRGLLFSGTVGTNLLVAKPDATEEEMRAAIENAQAADFVFADPDGLNMEISQAGTNLSGGQKQRLSIARALVKNPPIFVFDDSFSALDFKTDAALRKVIRENITDRTIFVVTQRVATAKNSDQILVLDDGHLVGTGTHKELMEDCTTYQEIASSQLTTEELA